MNEKTFHSRRRFLAALTAAACASGFTGAMRSAVAKEAAGGKSPVRWVPGMELYTLGLKPADDIAAAFKALAALGYREVEFSGHYDRSFAELKRALDGAGLAGPALHALPRPMKGAWDLTGDLSKFAADVKTLGVSFVVASIPLLPDRIYDVLKNPPKGFDVAAASRLFASLEADDWKRTADLLNAKGAVLAKHGLRLDYHNHGMEFLALPGHTNGFRLLVERTDPKLVSFELDVGWAVSAGQELPPLFRLLGERIRLLQLKDTKRPSTSVMELASTDAGTGIVKWNEVVDFVRRGHVEHMFVEQEEPFPTTPMDAAKIDYEFFTQLFAGGK